jgi:hypothetical protein
MELPSYEQYEYLNMGYNNWNLEDFITNIRYNRDVFMNYITISSFVNFPNNEHKPLIYNYGKLLNVNLKKYPQLLKYVITAIIENVPEDWVEKIDTNGCIYYENKHLHETTRVHPMTNYYHELIREKKKNINKKKSCSIM